MTAINTKRLSKLQVPSWAGISMISAKIQKYRIKRNRSVYESDLMISRTEVAAILETARQFWAKTKLYLKTQNEQLELFEDF